MYQKLATSHEIIVEICGTFYLIAFGGLPLDSSILRPISIIVQGASYFVP